ncbi:hypothetical protein G6F50_014478 [Rhizopus delemar]|uniref:Uncharacterized protein n=1 Tax=Rhizopus delemar TaxID=936053 RepID=A0A9P6Y4Y8_9FUNG|nr:hypothetical protein G6F50_014478 [Rhizopus delemar]
MRRLPDASELPLTREAPLRLPWSTAATNSAMPSDRVTIPSSSTFFADVPAVPVFHICKADLRILLFTARIAAFILGADLFSPCVVMPASALPSPTPLTPATRRYAMLAVSLSISMATLDTSMTNTALPSIAW